jgi:hypothetical protein
MKPVPLPNYAVDLLLAAKAAHHCGDPSRLGDAIERFENQMPLISNGEILTVSLVERGADNVIPFLHSGA